MSNDYWRVASRVKELQERARKQYCIIKSYFGDESYDDGNLDVVVDGKLTDVYSTIYSDDFYVSTKDLLKHKLYERNKLMLTPCSDGYAKVHLHSNVGWHDICLIPPSKIFAGLVKKEVFGVELNFVNLREEAVISILHVLFEKFKLSERDRKFISDSDLSYFRNTYNIDCDLFDPRYDVRDHIRFPILYRFWREFYSRHDVLTFRSLFWKILFLALQFQRGELKY